MSGVDTRLRIKQLIVESLQLDGMTPEMIADDVLLWGEGLGLDSVDALELVVALEKEYGFKIENEEIDREALATVASLAVFVTELRASQKGA